MKVGVITLGCDKNTVDSERYAASLVARGAEMTTDLGEAGLIVINTCGFIDAAKKESIDAIVEAGRYKDEGTCRAVVAVGCMVQRHKSELEQALPEVDLFLGSSEVDRLLPELEERGLLDDAIEMHPGERIFAGELPHVRYLKVSEGCDHGCAFCAIPLMRGKHRSFALDEVVRRATSGIARRSIATRSRITLRRSGRRMRLSTASEACCIGMSRYGTILGSRATVSRSSGVIPVE